MNIFKKFLQRSSSLQYSSIPFKAPRLPNRRLVSSIATMAAASQVHLSPEHAGIFQVPEISKESTQLGSELLQENHDKHHMLFNTEGFHNHIAHHLLTIYALGATTAELQQAFDDHVPYQRSHFPVDDAILADMSDPSKFTEYLGQEKYFNDYMRFFESRFERDGWQNVVNEYLFSGTEVAEELLVRMFAGFLHPLIHLGFGVEFQQPAIIAEALAQAAIHDNWVKKFLVGAEEAAKTSHGQGKSMVELIHEIRANKKLVDSPHWEDPNKVRDGIFKRAPDEMIALASQWTVKPEDLEKKTAEMINADAWFTGAAQRPDKEVKFDFFYMHCMNCSIFFSGFLQQEWMTRESKVRLLEWKGRMDLALYVSRGSAELLTDEITGYKAKHPKEGWEEIFRRVDAMSDDGHASKLVRAIKNGEEACKNYEGDGGEAFPIKGPMWLNLGHMAIDSVDDTGERPKWARNVGFAQAWDKMAARARL